MFPVVSIEHLKVHLRTFEGFPYTGQKMVHFWNPFFSESIYVTQITRPDLNNLNNHCYSLAHTTPASLPAAHKSTSSNSQSSSVVSSVSSNGFPPMLQESILFRIGQRVSSMYKSNWQDPITTPPFSRSEQQNYIMNYDQFDIISMWFLSFPAEVNMYT